jgi:uncharacterized protein YjbJ (UPF0337 family)
MDERKLADDGVDNRVKGTAKNVEGKVREAIGDLTDDGSEQLKGKAQQVKGRLQNELGKAQIDAADDLADDV